MFQTQELTTDKHVFAGNGDVDGTSGIVPILSY